MNTSSAVNSNASGKRSRSKLTIGDDDASPVKRMKPDCCAMSDLNRSRIYNFGYRKKPAELFRKDLISAMKMADSEQLIREDYLEINDPWREEWEKGVQVPVYPDNLPISDVRILREPKTDTNFKIPKKLIKSDIVSEPIQSDYELDLLDMCWVQTMNDCDSVPIINDSQLEFVINELEHQCARNMKAKHIGIEYDDHIICDVCRSPDGEEGNEMVFCDLCNICVHQACYGITEIPDGDWLCRPCKEFGTQKRVSCVLCPNLGGALKQTNNSNQWCHVSCALWIPEVSIGNVSTMEPITKIKQIPQTRWNLICSLCNIKKGAPIQCSVKTCKTAYHVICAFNHKLKMKAIVDANGGKGVKLKSYCKKHSEKDNIDDDANDEQKTESEVQNVKDHHEIDIASAAGDGPANENETEFWKYIDINKIQHEIQKRHKKQFQTQSKTNYYIDFVLQYWKLKRTSNYGASLIKLPSSAQFEEQLIQQRMEIMRLRVDLERIRNLSYMICRREKVKRNWLKAHQSTVEKAMTIFAGNPNSEIPKNVHVTEESVKLVREIVKNSVIYDYKEEDNKIRSNAIIRTLKRLSKIEKIQKHKPNPYAKFYISHVKRKNEKDSDGSTQTVNCTVSSSPVNGVLSKSRNHKPLNGLSPSHVSFNAPPLNGYHGSNSTTGKFRVSIAEEKSLTAYRQSSRSLLKPKVSSSNTVSSPPVEEKPQTPAPILTRSSLSGYKIPKKKQEQNTQSLTKADIDKLIDATEESIQDFKKRMDSHIFASQKSPQTDQKISPQCNHTSQSYHPERIDYYHNHQSNRGASRFMLRGKSDGTFCHKNGRQQSILSNVTTRGQGFDDATLMASAATDIDMRRQNSIGFRPSLIH